MSRLPPCRGLRRGYSIYVITAMPGLLTAHVPAASVHDGRSRRETPASSGLRRRSSPAPVHGKLLSYITTLLVKLRSRASCGRNIGAGIIDLSPCPVESEAAGGFNCDDGGPPHRIAVRR